MSLFRFFFLFSIIAILGLGIYAWKNKAVFIEAYLSHKLSVDVHVKNVQVGWNSLKLQEFSIENPVKSSYPYAFTTEALVFKADFLSLLKKKKCVNELAFHHPTLLIELFNYSGTANNWARLINLMYHNKEDIPIRIDRVRIFDLHFNGEKANGRSLAPMPSIPYLELESCRYSGLSQALGSIFEEMASHAVHSKNLLSEIVFQKEMKHKSIEGN